MFFPLNNFYPAQYESRLKLDNEKEVFLRPIMPTDEILLIDLFNKLSSDSLYLRFLRPLNAIPKDMLFHLTHMDYHHSFALVAVVREDGKDSIIAVARYGYDPEEDVTDFAIAVRDDWQQQGLGKSLLLKILAIGREHGISHFVSIIDSTNKIIKQLLRKLAYPVKYSYGNGSTQVEISIERL
jgi:acetyltransferase